MTEHSFSVTYPSTGKHGGGRPKGTTYDDRDRHCYDMMQSLIDRHLVSCLRTAAREALPLAYLYGPYARRGQRGDHPPASDRISPKPLSLDLEFFYIADPESFV